MNNKNHPDSLITRTEDLREVIGELSEVHSLLAVLSGHLEGGGIVQARSLEPIVREAVPRLRDALEVMNRMAGNALARGPRADGADPLLM